MTYPNGPADRPAGDQSPWGQYRPATGRPAAGECRSRECRSQGGPQPWGSRPNAGQWGPAPGGQQPPPWGAPTGAAPTQQFGQPQQPPYGGQQTGAQPTQQFGPNQPNWGPPTAAQPPQTGSQQSWGQQPWNPQAQQGWSQPGQPGGQPQWGPPAAPGGYGPPPKKSNKGILITAVAVVVALLAGFGIWWFAIRDTSTAGKDTPQQAAAQLFADIDNGDVVALADTFDPVEASLVNDLAGDVVEQFKRLGLLTDDATVGSSTGSTISIKGITFDDSAAETPLPDLTIVKLTGGKITITPADTSGAETDLFSQLKDAVSQYSDEAGLPGQAAVEPTTIDIAELVKDNGGQPIRISTVLRDDSWYPSLFYTALDYWAQDAGLGPVTTDDYIAGVGAGSPEQAVEGMITAISEQNAEHVIQLLPPDEMAAVHAYGQKLVEEAGSPSSEPTISDFQAEWVTSEVTGGTLVSISAVEFTANGEHGRIELNKDAGTATVTANGETRTFDAAELANQFGTGDLSEIHPNMPDFVARMLKAVMGLGVVTTNVDGSWYVSPVRTVSGVFTTLLSGMEQSDIQMFIDLANK